MSPIASQNQFSVIVLMNVVQEIALQRKVIDIPHRFFKQLTGISLVKNAEQLRVEEENQKQIRENPLAVGPGCGKNHADRNERQAIANPGGKVVVILDHVEEKRAGERESRQDDRIAVSSSYHGYKAEKTDDHPFKTNEIRQREEADEKRQKIAVFSKLKIHVLVLDVQHQMARRVPVDPKAQRHCAEPEASKNEPVPEQNFDALPLHQIDDNQDQTDHSENKPILVAGQDTRPRRRSRKTIASGFDAFPRSASSAMWKSP